MGLRFPADTLKKLSVLDLDILDLRIKLLERTAYFIDVNHSPFLHEREEQ